MLEHIYINHSSVEFRALNKGECLNRFNRKVKAMDRGKQKYHVKLKL